MCVCAPSCSLRSRRPWYSHSGSLGIATRSSSRLTTRWTRWEADAHLLFLNFFSLFLTTGCVSSVHPYRCRRKRVRTWRWEERRSRAAAAGAECVEQRGDVTGCPSGRRAEWAAPLAGPRRQDQEGLTRFHEVLAGGTLEVRRLGGLRVKATTRCLYSTGSKQRLERLFYLVFFYRLYRILATLLSYDIKELLWWQQLLVWSFLFYYISMIQSVTPPVPCLFLNSGSASCEWPSFWRAHLLPSNQRWRSSLRQIS